MTSMMERTLKLLRKRGCLAAPVERWNPYAKVRQDLFEFGDIVACGGGMGPTLVQCTSGAHHAARRNKILGLPKAKAWADSGGAILIISWLKQGPRGKRKLWYPREEWLSDNHGCMLGIEFTIPGENGDES